VGGLTLNLEIALNNWINSLNTASSLDSPLVHLIFVFPGPQVD
jgi:hypothetical protein